MFKAVVREWKRSKSAAATFPRLACLAVTVLIGGSTQAQPPAASSLPAPQPVVHVRGTVAFVESQPYESYNDDNRGHRLLMSAATCNGDRNIGSYELIDERLYLGRKYDAYDLTGVVELDQPAEEGSIDYSDRKLWWRRYGFVESAVSPAAGSNDGSSESAVDTLQSLDRRFTPKQRGSLYLIESLAVEGAFGGVLFHSEIHDGVEWRELPDEKMYAEVLLFKLAQRVPPRPVNLPSLVTGQGSPAADVLGNWRFIGDEKPENVTGLLQDYPLWTIENERMIDRRRNVSTIIRIDPSLRHIDLKGDGNDQWILGVYEVQGDRLTIALGNVRPNGAEDPQAQRLRLVRDR